MDKEQLFIELENIQDRGIMIYIEGVKSTPKTVSALI